MFWEAECPPLRNSLDDVREQGRRRGSLNFHFGSCPQALLVFVDFDESPQAAIVGPFHIIRKETGRKLFHAPVILQAFTADSLSTARVVTAVAVGHVFIRLTVFHAILRL